MAFRSLLTVCVTVASACASAASGPSSDERSQSAPIGPDCPDGAPCAPTASCQDATVLADATCRGLASIDAGSSDADGDAQCVQSPAGPYPLGATPVTLTCSDPDPPFPAASCTATVFVVDRTPPSITCPPDQTLECTAEGAMATFAPTAADNCGVALLACDRPSGSTFPEDGSPTTDTCTATDGAGNQASCAFHVTVKDTLPPVVTVHTDASGYSVTLWPPNHRYREVSVADCASIVDRCDGPLPPSAAVILAVTSDEPVLGGGSGHTEPDVVIAADGHSVQLRAEREGTSDGRVYTIRARAADDEGNVTGFTCKVQVPHDQSGAAAVDSGAAYCVGAGC